MNKIFFSAIFLLAVPLYLNAQQFTVTPFTGVEAKGVFTVQLTQGENHEVTIDADQNILPDVSVEVVGDMLVLRYMGSARNIGRIMARVTAPYFLTLQGGDLVSFSSEQPLRSPVLRLEGSSASRFDLQVETEDLSTNLSGASRVNLSGIATSHTATLSGTSLLDASDLATESTQVDLSGASKGSVYATTIISGEASGASVLAIKGAPVSQNIELSGMATIEGLEIETEPTAQAENNAERVRVGPVQIRINDNDNNDQDRDENNNRFRNNWTGIELGINGYLTPDYSLTMPVGQESFELRYERSTALNINIYQQNINLVRNRLGLFTGIGLGWNNYRFGNDALLVKGPQEAEFVAVPEPGLRKNKLTVTWVNVPVMLEFQKPASAPGPRFFLSAGLNLGARISSHTKQVYMLDNGRDRRRLRGDFYLNPFRFDLQARMGIGKIGLFASYSLNSLFRDERGPQLYPFSVGLRLTSF